MASKIDQEKKPLTGSMEDSQKSDRPSSSNKQVITIGLVFVAFIFLGLGAWAATAPLARAISAAAVLVVKGERKKVQHLEGGIVSNLYISEGDLVKEGQILLSLDPLQANANVARYYNQLDQLLAKEARLAAELRGDEYITFSGPILNKSKNNPEFFEIVETEQQNFEARKQSFNGHINILNQRIEQLNIEIEGLEIQRAARLEQHRIFSDEMIGLRALHEKGYFPRSQLLAAERAIVNLRGAAGQDTAQIARAKSAQGEARNQIISVRQRFREEVVEDIGDVKGEINDLNERLLVAQDILKRVEIRAPRSGIVQGIRVHTIGGVVRPGDLLMEIAPQDDDLVVQAQISPVDADLIIVGQEAEIRLSALNVRTTPTIYGTVVSVSGDALTDSDNRTKFFLSQIEIPQSELVKLGDVKLSAGMPAEVLIQAGERTLLNYLVKPMSDALMRGLNEE